MRLQSLLPAEFHWRQTGPLFGLAGIVLIAIAIRVYGIGFGLPYLDHPDESVNYNIIVGMLNEQSLSPGRFTYPTLTYYFQRSLLEAVYLVGKGLGYYNGIQDIQPVNVLAIGVGKIENPAVFLLMRLFSMLAGVAAVVMVYLCGRQWWPGDYRGILVGLIAAFFTALSPTLVGDSRFITPDIWGVLFILVSFRAGIAVYRNDATRNYVWAGIAVGLAAGTKYVGGIVGIVMPVAHVLRNLTPGAISWRQFLIDWRVIVMGLISLLAFLATSPYVILDFKVFLSDFLFIFGHYAKSHPGMEGETLLFYSRLLFAVHGPISVLAVAGVAWGLATSPKRTILFCSFPIAYFLMIVDVPVRNDRTLMPVLPFVFLLAAVFLVNLKEAIRSRYPKIPALLLLAVAVPGLVAVPASRTFRDSVALAAPKPSDAARAWLAENLPAGSSVLIESYSPYIDPSRFDVSGVFSMSEPEAAEYLSRDPDYLVFSARQYGRFVYHPAAYPEQAAIYANLFASHDLIATFGGGGSAYEIRIFRSRDPGQSGNAPAPDETADRPASAASG
jgi:hypothetical protein